MSDPNLWLEIAISDLESAVILRDAHKPNQAAYHAQQAAEKALKGYLVLHEVRIKKVHDLMLLITECAEIDHTFLELIPQAEYLKPFSTKSRYPDDYIDLEFDEVKLLTEYAEIIVNFVAKYYKNPIQKRLPLD